MDWIFYYERNGEILSTTSEDAGGDPAKAPADGVLVVGQKDPGVGWLLVQRPDAHFFVWVEEHKQWDAKDIYGLYDVLRNYPGAIVRFGRGVPDELFRKALDMAIHDDRRPPKSGRHPREYPLPADFRYERLGI